MRVFVPGRLRGPGATEWSASHWQPERPLLRKGHVLASDSFLGTKLNSLEFLPKTRMAGYSTILPANVTGQQFSKMDDSNRELAISVAPRKLT
jgi:hypothetical protein